MILYKLGLSNKENTSVYFITDDNNNYSTPLFTNINSVRGIINQYNNSGMFPMVKLPKKACKQCELNKIDDLYRLMPEEFI